MKNVSKISNILILSLILIVSFSFLSQPASGRIKVYLENQCDADAKVNVAVTGSSTHYTVGDKEKKPFLFAEGTQVYDVEGNLVIEITADDQGKTFVICEKGVE